MSRRVVVTGLGVVSPIGIGKEDFWNSIVAGKCGIGPVTQFDVSSYPCKYAATVKDFRPLDFFPPKTIRHYSRGTQFSVVSSQLAVEDAGLNLEAENPSDFGVVFGTGMGPMDVIDRFCSLFYERGLKRVNPFFLGMINKNSIVGAIANRFGAKGYHLCIAAGCSAGNVAIAQGYQAVANGFAEVIIAGGVETPISPSIFALYAASEALSSLNGGDPTKTMCPYDRRRSGFILGEGSGSIILESLEHARKRGANIYAEILSSSLTNDGEDAFVFSPDEKEMTSAIKKALKSAEVSIGEVDYVCAHAHSSVILDRKETRAIKRVFGQDAYRLKVSTIKAMIGHSMAGGTAMQSITACLALQRGVLPPTINYEVADPECDLDYVPNEAQEKKIQIAMVDSFGLGGTNVVLLYRTI